MEFRLQQGRNPVLLTPRSSIPAVCPKGPPWALTNADLCRGLLATGTGRPSSKTPTSASAWSNAPSTPKAFHAQRGREFLGLEPAYRAESLKSPGKRAVVTKEGNKSTHEPTRR